MARLRFPGRPGHRFDRVSVKYFADDVKNISDPVIAFLPQFKKGLQLFRALVGESDEDEEFEGFSAEEVHLAEKKLRKHQHEEKERQTSPTEVSLPTDTLGTRLKIARQSLENLPASGRTRGRNKVVVRKSYKDMISQGLVSPSKTHEILKSKDVVSPEEKQNHKKSKIHKVSPTNFKLDQKYDVPGGRVKKTDKDMAKFLLEKAKQAQKLAQQRRERAGKTQTQVHRREFVLPTQSSRSSRVIIPNKRFLEDDSVHSVVKKKTKSETVKESKQTKPKVDDSLKSEKQDERPVGLLDQPVIVAGKRERKLSLKMRQKSTDFGLWEDYADFQKLKQASPPKPLQIQTSPSQPVLVSSPLAAPKLGTSLFSQSGSQFKKASEQQRLGMMGLTASRKKGASILQKAKLQLNRDDLNKSKAALARSLKAKMKREAKFEFSQHQAQQSKPPEAKQPSVIHIAEDGSPKPVAEETKRKPKKRCSICRSRENLATAGTTVACLACRDFFWRKKKFIGVKEFVCNEKGNCTFSPNNRKSCRACRIKQCLEQGMMKGETLPRIKKLFYKKYIVPGVDKKPNNSDHVSAPLVSLSAGPSSPKPLKLENTPVALSPVLSTPSVSTKLKSPSESSVKSFPPTTDVRTKPKSMSDSEISKTIESVVHTDELQNKKTDETSTESSVKLRTLSGEIREHKRKKQKAFKELLRAKQERTENLPAIPDTPKSAPIPISPKETTEVKTSPQSAGRGPRIKHVCRNAAVALGKNPATFPPVSEIRLSALPTKEKVQLWKKEEAEKAAKVDSDDERPIEEIIQHSSDNVCIIKKSPAHAAKEIKKKAQHPALKPYKRKTRCRKCPGCLAEACGVCRNCLDMPKFGGSGTLKQACIKRKCRNPTIRRGGTEAFLDLKTDNSGTDSNAGSTTSSPRKQSCADGQGSSGQHASGASGTLSLPQVTFDNTVNTAGSEKRRLDFGRVSSSLGVSPDRMSHRLPTRGHPGKINSKRIKVDIQEKYAKKTDSIDGQFYPVSLQSVIPASRHWGTTLSRPESHRIKVDYKESYALSLLWKKGMALTMAGSICVRTLCYLCGSAGKHELIYCNVCCEPFHEFCLDEDVPSYTHLDDWVCPQCQFCHVCGRQNNLLQCDKCHDMYHPECLGPNYPTKPSKKKGIWICTKCVKCKSCGATTPGTASHATWTYDFSLCYECGQLMDKGNFCPICRKCYSDDDWESKMIQCGMCESWVHARCEGLSDEMYEILSYMPEDMSFNCRKCFPVGCPEWEMTLKRELRNGLENILQTLTISKCSQYIYKYEKKKSPQKAGIKSPKKEENKNSADTEKTSVGSENVKDVGDTCDKAVKDSGIQITDRTNIKKTDSDSLLTDITKATVLENAERSGECNNTVDEVKHIKENNFTDSGVDSAICQTGIEKARAESSLEINDCGKDSDASSQNNRVKFCTKEPHQLQCMALSGKEENNPNCVNVSGKNCTSLDLESGEINDTKKSACDDGKTKCDNSGFTCKGQTAESNVCDSATTKSNAIEETKNQTNLCSNRDSKSVVTCEKTLTEICEGDTEMKIRTPYEDPHKTEINKELAETQLSSDSGDKHTKRKDGSKSDTVSDKDKGSENSVKSLDHIDQKTETKVVAIKGSESSHHVHFAEELPFKIEPQHPKDLIEVREKMTESGYKSVASFSEDIMRIIQDYLDDSEETRCTRKKAVNSARSVFVKQMERIFPWYNVKTCRYWYSNKNFPRGMLPDATLPPSTDHTYAQWLEREELPLSPQPSPFKKLCATPVKKLRHLDDEDGDPQTFLEGEDTRKCILCLKYGDQECNDEGRLLYCSQDDWVHVNCALWSAEVYEDTDGSLQNLKEAYSRGKMLKCEYCQRAGATVGCNTRGCIANYHFMCARHDRCVFQTDKKIFCNDHRSHADKEVLTADRFSVTRRVFVKNQYIRTVKKSWLNGLMPTDISVVIGSCTVECLGKLTDLSDRPRFLIPVNYMCTRVYWSTKDARRRCVYTCTVKEVFPEALKSPTVPIKDMRIVHDEGHPEYVPLSKLNLEEMGISIADKEAVSGKSSENSVIDLTTANEDSDCVYVDATGETTLDAGSLSSSFGGRDSSKLAESKSLSESWPGARASQTLKQNSYKVDLTVLSPATQKLLNLKDMDKYSKTETKTEGENEDFSLLKIADRLNRAAAKSRRNSEERNLTPKPSSSRSSRSPSVERQNIPRPFSPVGTSVTRPFSPPVRMKNKSRSPSVEKIGSPVPFQGATTSDVSSMRVPRPFSPPTRLVSKSRSPSVEKINETEISFPLTVQSSDNKMSNPSSTEKQCLEKSYFQTVESSSIHHLSSMGTCVSPVKTCSLVCKSTIIEENNSVSDNRTRLNSNEIVSPDPKPLSASSPLEHKTKSNFTMDENTRNDADCMIINTSQPLALNLNHSKVPNGEQSADSSLIVDKSIKEFDLAEKSSIDVNVSEEATETIIIMTDSCEDISEEEALLIAQAAIEQKNSSSELSDTSDDNKVEGHFREGHGKFEERNEKNEPFTEIDSKDSEHQEEVVPSREMPENGNKNTCSREIDKEIERLSESPFIPKIAENDSCEYFPFKLRPTGTEQSEDSALSSACKTVETTIHISEDDSLSTEHENRINSSLESDISSMDLNNSEIVDITDSIVKATKTADALNLQTDELNFSASVAKTDPGCEEIDSDIEILDNIGSIEMQRTTESAKIDNLVAEEINILNKTSNVEQIGAEIKKIAVASRHENGEVKESNKTIQCDETEEYLEKQNGSRAEQQNFSQELTTVFQDEKMSSKSSENLTNDEKCRTSTDKENNADRTEELSNKTVQDTILHEFEDDENPVKEQPCLKHNDDVRPAESENQNISVKENTEDEIDGDNSSSSVNMSFTEGHDRLEYKENIVRIPLSESDQCDSLHVDIIQNIDYDIDTSSQPEVTITPEIEGSPDSQDKNIFERMKEYSLRTDASSLKKDEKSEGTSEGKIDERSEAEKQEVLRGLGLERSEDVEKARKSPKSPKSPLKTYPLRKNMMSPARYRDTEDLFAPTKQLLKAKAIKEADVKDKYTILPVLDPIAKKIKLESLAKSCTDDRGPFRCQTCKRSYRTETSLKLHTEKCDFEVSTSDDEESDSYNSGRNCKNKDTKDKSDSLQAANALSSLRQSTIVQRVALEVEEKRIKEEGALPKRRGRPSLSKDSSKPDTSYLESLTPPRHSYRRTIPKNESSASNYIASQVGISRGRGRPRKQIGQIKHNPNNKHDQYVGKNTNNKNHGKNPDFKARRPGRPRKYFRENSQGNVKYNLKQLKSRERLSFRKVQSPLFTRTRNILKHKLTLKVEAKEKNDIISCKESIPASQPLNPGFSEEENNPQPDKAETPCSKRGRGRPRKLERTSSDNKQSSSGKRNGRSSGKEERSLVSKLKTTVAEISESSGSGLKRGRGRPKTCTSQAHDDKHTIGLDRLASETEYDDDTYEGKILRKCKHGNPVDDKEQAHTVTSNPGHKRGRGRPRIYTKEEIHKPKSEKGNPGSSGEDNNSDSANNPGSDEETAPNSKQSTSGHSIVKGNTAAALPGLKRGRGRPRKLIQSDAEDKHAHPVNDEQVHDEDLKKRDVPTLKEEVESFRRIKRLKRESSQEKVSLDVIQISSSSDEDIEEPVSKSDRSPGSRSWSALGNEQEMVRSQEVNTKPIDQCKSQRSTMSNKKSTVCMENPSESSQNVSLSDSVGEFNKENNSAENEIEVDEDKDLKQPKERKSSYNKNVETQNRENVSGNKSDNEHKMANNAIMKSGKGPNSKNGNGNIDSGRRDEVQSGKSKYGNPSKAVQYLKNGNGTGKTGNNNAKEKQGKNSETEQKGSNVKSVNTSEAEKLNVQNIRNDIKRKSDDETSSEKSVKVPRELVSESIQNVNCPEIQDNPGHKIGIDNPDFKGSNNKETEEESQKMKTNSKNNPQTESASASNSQSSANESGTKKSTSVSKTETTNSLSAASDGSLSSTVLKLLKEGHKVLIKNPKLGKSFLWEKTEKGYVGRPYEPKSTTKMQGLEGKSPVSTNSAETNQGQTTAIHSTREAGNEGVTTIQSVSSSIPDQQKPTSTKAVGGIEFKSVTEKVAYMTKLKTFDTNSSSGSLQQLKRLTADVEKTAGMIPDTVSEGRSNQPPTESDKKVGVISATVSEVVNMIPTFLNKTSSHQQSPAVQMLSKKLAEAKKPSLQETSTIRHVSGQRGDERKQTSSGSSRVVPAKENPVIVSPNTSLEYLGGLVLSSTGSISLFKQSVTQVSSSCSPAVPGFPSGQNVQTVYTPKLASIQSQPPRLLTSIQSQPPRLIASIQSQPPKLTSLQSQPPKLMAGIQSQPPRLITSIQSQPPVESQLLHILQTGIQRMPVANLLPQTTFSQSNSNQMTYNPSVMQYSPNFMSPNQPLNIQQISYLNRQPASNLPLRPESGLLQPQGGLMKPQTGLLRPSSGLVTAPGGLVRTPGGPVLQSSPSVLQPLLPTVISTSSSVPAFSSVLSTAEKTQLAPSDSQNQGFSMKNSEAVAKDVADIVKNLQKHSSIQLPHQSICSNSAGQPFSFADALRATANLSRENQERNMPSATEHQFTSLIKQTGNNYYNKVRQMLSKRILTPKTTHYPLKRFLGNKPYVSFQEMKNGLVQGQVKPNLGKPAMKIEKAGPSIHPLVKKRPYGKSAGNLSPLKRRGRPRAGRGGSGSARRKSPLRVRKIDGPHSLGSGSHPIIHAQKEVTSLPAAAVEEEVVETPLDAMYDQLDKRQQGTSKTREDRGHLEFEISSDDGFNCKSDSIDGAWRQVIEKVQDARTASRLKQLSYGGLNGLSMSGLSHPNNVYLIEQLHGAGYCHTYKFRYHSHELRRLEEPPENPSGCIRTEPFDGRKPYDMFSFLMSRYRVKPAGSASTGDNEMILKSSRRATSMDLPMAMRFRKLKEHSREAVGVYRSRIHGRGLFCKRNIDGGEMVIEYAGEVIRGSLTDIREKYYESKGIGCYMFRIDDTDVVDATMKGSAARFINHSCEPNCYSKVITVDNRKHIVIFASRPIERGEELTYDYKFPIEDVKILCTCGSRRCRKYLN